MPDFHSHSSLVDPALGHLTLTRLPISIFPYSWYSVKYYWRLLNHLFSRNGYAATSSLMASSPPGLYPDAHPKTDRERDLRRIS